MYKADKLEQYWHERSANSIWDRVTHRQGSPPGLIREGAKVLVHHVLPWPCSLHLPWHLNPLLEELQVLVSNIPAPENSPIQDRVRGHSKE